MIADRWTKERAGRRSCGVPASAGGSALRKTAVGALSVLALMALRVQPADASPGRAILASVDESGRADVGASGASLAGDGTKVVFEAFRTWTRDGSAYIDVFVKDLTTGALTVVSTDAQGDVQDGHSRGPSISADGTTVAFWSEATLHPDDTASGPDLYAKDLQTGAVTLVSANRGTGSIYDYPVISADGSKVAYTGLYPEDFGGGGANTGVYVQDLSTGQRTIVNRGADGRRFRAGSPALSADGSKVAFSAEAVNGCSPLFPVVGCELNSRGLDPRDTDQFLDVYVRDLTTGLVRLVSTTTLETKGNAESRQPTLSGDGTKVAFQSAAVNLDPADTEGGADVYVKDLLTGQLRLASTSAAGTKFNRPTHTPLMSDDGTAVVVNSGGTNVLPEDTDTEYDVYVKHLSGPSAGQVELASADCAGMDNGAPAYVQGRPRAMSADGSRVVFFTSWPHDPRDLGWIPAGDLYVKDLTSSCPSASISGPATVAEGTGGSSSLTATVTLSAPHPDPVSLEVSTQDGTATAGSDYTATTANLVFPPGTTSQQLTVPVTPDVTDESDETFTVAITDDFGNAALGLAPKVRNATLGTASSAVTILDDEQPDAASGVASAGGTVSTGNSPTPTDPVETSVQTPGGGAVAIQETTITQAAPATFTFVAQQVNITAPAATTTSPLLLTFRLDAAAVAAGQDVESVQVFRNGVLVPLCLRDGGAEPNPCVASRTLLSGGDVEIAVRTSAASAWNFGTSTNRRPTASAGPDATVASGGSASLDGSGSSDPEGAPLTYRWVQLTGPVAVLQNDRSARLTVAGVRGPATLTFRLVVTDSLGQQHGDTATVTVTKPK